jgi:type IV pilus assembly protein PilN
MIRINLIAAERAPQAKKKSASAPSAPGAWQLYLFLLLFVGGAVGVSVFLGIWKKAQIADLDRRIAEAEKRQRELQAIKQQVEALEAKRATYQKKIDIIQRLQKEQTGPVHMLDEVSKALPDFVWLTALNETGPGGIGLTGNANSLVAVADYITALEKSGWFTNVEMGPANVDANNLVSFSLKMQFKNLANVAKPATPPAAAPPQPGAPPAPGN